MESCSRKKKKLRQRGEMSPPGGCLGACIPLAPLGTPPGAPYKGKPRGQGVDKETTYTVHTVAEVTTGVLSTLLMRHQLYSRHIRCTVATSLVLVF